MKKHRIVCVIGTRPEALKMIPIIRIIQKKSEISLKIVITGQHRELLSQILSHEGINNFTDFHVMSTNQTLNSLSASLFASFNDYLTYNPCDLVIAQGDTTTTLVAATAAFHQKIAFAHIEAGLRTSKIDSPFPEEFNRRVVTLASSLHFCPTASAADNLKKEGINQHIYVTGNTIIDMLSAYIDKNWVPSNNKKIILVTCHRRENLGKPLNRICEALKKIAQKNPELEIILPIHPNPNVKNVVEMQLKNISNIRLTSPLSYQKLIEVMQQSWLVLTDSGGIQEEAPALHKPVLVLRNETERFEAIECGASRLVGTETQVIVNEVENLLVNPSDYAAMANAGSPYGDGNAARRIVAIILNYLNSLNGLKSNGAKVYAKTNFRGSSTVPKAFDASLQLVQPA